MAHLHSGILCSRKKEEAPTICDSMDGTGEHYAKWNRPGSERQIPCDLIHQWNLINKTNLCLNTLSMAHSEEVMHIDDNTTISVLVKQAISWWYIFIHFLQIISPIDKHGLA